MRQSSARDLPNLLYDGKTTSCYAQALITAFPSVFSEFDLWFIDTLTTVPFGVIYKTSDPNRLLDCYLDPDVGLDRALSTLGIEFETCWWSSQTDGSIPLELLTTWCQRGPVLLGPLDMGLLPYLFHSYLFTGLDHYIVVIGIEHHRIYLCDPEMMPYITLTDKELLATWRAERVPEGRGTFIMRQIITSHPVQYHHSGVAKTLRFIASNLQAAQAHQMGGYQGLLALANEEDTVIQHASLHRGLIFALSTRIQRCKLGMRFLQIEAVSKAVCAQHSLWKNCIQILEEQTYLYAYALALITKGSPSPLRPLCDVAALEKQLTALFHTMVDAL